MPDATIESILQEERRFPPPTEFSQAAHIQSLADYQHLCDRAQADPEAFWATLAEQELHWFQPWNQVLDWQPPFSRWFVGGKLNISYNCLDRHLTDGRSDQIALIWEGEPGDSRQFTFEELHQEVCQMSNALKRLGVHKGDPVGIYMPMIPEVAIAMLACARIGAPHVVVFGGFSAEALKDRLIDAHAKVLITADGGWRKDAIVPVKEQVNQALAKNSVPSVQQVLVVQRTGQAVTMQPGRDHWWHELRQGISTDCPSEPMDSEDTLFILYTSGTTGKPKGVIHTTGGYSLFSHITTQWIFDVKDTDILWCTADVGWVTGHSYVIYGPLSNGVTTLMYEGAPRPSNPGCLWDIIEKYRVTIFYTAPTLIRTAMRMGEELPKARDLSSLRLLGSVGEPINPTAWMWYYQVIGGERCPIADTWWQTETGGVMIAPLPGAIPTKPGSATLPLPGISAAVVDSNGNPIGENQGGYLVILQPWPGMIRNIHGNPDRYRKTYWEPIPPKQGQYFYFTGDGARRDQDGYFWIMGRIDDVVNVAGHRLGTMEVESALVSHAAVAEAAVVGRPEVIKGEEIVAFVTLEDNYFPSEQLAQELQAYVANAIGAIARPAEIRFSETLPKTRSGKIMRRLLRSLVADQAIVGDISTLEDRDALEQLRAKNDRNRHNA
jgi:acetyl-CoA synthetase